MEHKSYENRNAEIAKFVKSGIPLKEIAKWYNMTRERVRQISKDYGIPTFTRADREERNRKIVQRLKKGISREQVGRDFNVGKLVIQQLAVKNGIPSDWKKKIDKRDRAIAALSKKGIPPSEIAARFKMTRESVLQVVHKYGIWYRPPSRKPMVLKMLKEGISASVIAKKLGITTQAVYFNREKKP